jgi:4'-phosphopantetheinyl transferase EntD
MSREVRQLLAAARRRLRASGLELGFASRDELERFVPCREEERLAVGLRARRRRDFLLGRFAARRALDQLGGPAGPVLTERGAPLFPAPAAGSISHSSGVAVALAGRAAALGVDVELRRLSERGARYICAPEELRWIAGDADRATVLFSAKESVYKALTPARQRGLVLRDIVIEPRGERFGAAVAGAPLAVAGGWLAEGGILTWATG